MIFKIPTEADKKYGWYCMSMYRLYAPCLAHLLNRGGRVATVGFMEWLSPALLQLESLGAELVDLEHDLGAFDHRLDRPYSPQEYPE